MRPSHPGPYLRAILQQKTRAGWKTLVAWRAKLSRKSTAAFKIRYLRRTVIGHTYRLIASFNGDASLAAVSWGYWYLKITR
jgi:hypothetical protein